jgi:DNA-directed RNA polymerase subunit beta'
MLEGLKENVIVGRLIPAGTGGQLRRYQEIAAEKDAHLLATGQGVLRKQLEEQHDRSGE